MNHLLNEEQFPAGFLPAWFEARRRHALEQAEQLPEPSRHMESWRFGAPGNESLEHVEAAPPAAPETLAPIIRERASMPEALRIVYVNGLPVSIPEELPEGLSVMDMEDFVLQCPDTARKYLETATLAQTMAANSAERSSSTIFPPRHLSNTHWFRNLTAVPVPWSFPI